MDIIIETTGSSFRNNKDQRVDPFKTDENKGKKISPRMGLFFASGTV